MNLFRRALNTGCVAAWAVRERRLPYWPLDRIVRLQNRRVRAAVERAYRTVPFYRRAMEERGLRPADFRSAEDLARLPLIDGVLLRRHGQLFQSEAHAPASCFCFNSSGSQFHAPRQIYWDHRSVLRQLACEERSRAVLSALVGQDWAQTQLFLLPSGSQNLRLRAFWDSRLIVPRFVARRHFLQAERPIQEAVDAINALRPQVVFSLGSYAEEFFGYLADRRPAMAPPKVWVWGGDMLAPQTCEWIEQTFGCKVYSTYQAVETGRIGFQCERRRGFHLNIDLCAVRLVNEAGQTVGPGEPGEIVVSALLNRAMAVFNYRLGDLGVLAPTACPCGRALPLLEEFQGRVGERICLPSGRRVGDLMLKSLFRTELFRTIQVQVLQPAPGRIVWRIVPQADADRNAVAGAFLSRCAEVLEGGIEASVEFVEQIPRTAAGKLRPVIPWPPPAPNATDGQPQRGQP